MTTPINAVPGASAPTDSPASDPVRTASESPAETPTVRQFFRRNTFWILLGIVALGVVLLSAILRGGASGTSIPLAADSPAPDGAKAVIEVLKNQGVTVHVADTAAEADAALVENPGATLAVFDSAGYLDSDRLSEIVSEAGRTVLIAPDFGMLQAVAPSVRLAGSPDEDEDAADAPAAACTVPAAERAGSMASGLSFGIDDDTSIGCFGNGPADAPSYPLVVTNDGISIVGPRAVFDNEHIVQRGNAALALNLLGETDTLVWYLPTTADLEASGPPTLQALTPDWLVPATSLLAITALVAIFWRGRRFGPLVVEDLPVTVPSGETREGRARLYQRSAARGRAVDALRIGATGRIAARLKLPRSSAVVEVADTAAATLGRHPSEIRALLVDAPPTSDRDVVALSDRLNDLERDIRHATDPLGRNS